MPRSIIRCILLATLGLTLATSTSAFVGPAGYCSGRRVSSSSALFVFASKNKKPASPPLPQFDKSTQRWIPPAEGEGEGYGPFGSLLRFGPVPFIKRLTNEDEYLQAVYKYQAQEKCTKMEAQGNMDAYFENPQDWMMQKMEERKGGYKRDYTLIDTKQVALTLTWAVIVTPIVFSIAFDLVSGNYCVENPAANFCVFTAKIIHPGRF